MSIQPKDIMERWDRIRSEEKCNLSLTPESVAEYLRISEANLVQARILESLIQFANRRLDPENKDKFVSTDPPMSGDMATCEGLEAFLVPAVEDALPFSKFLEHYQSKGGDKEGFVLAIKRDIEGLLKNWEKTRFSGEPYANPKKIKDSIDPNGIDPNFKDHFNQVNITESAALACRVLIHLLTLKLNRTATDEGLFQKEIGDELVKQMFASLANAIDFLVRAFQKNHDGATEEEQIVSSKVGVDIGSGWSWTDYPGLPPMLFFTAAAVDAFAELDLYLIRTVRKREWVGDGLRLAVFHKENEEKLQRFQLCVDMARRWVQTAILPALITGYGQYVERFPQGTKGALVLDSLLYNDKPTGYAQYKDDLDRWKERGLSHPPMVFYNSLYALQILLWSWGDWNDSGDSVDDNLKNQINRAISQLVYNYSSIPVVQEILNRFKYVFYLPGKEIFREGSEKECEYLDSAFLQLLTRLLVLFVVYGVGDRNMLEPVIRNLYVELLQNRHRNEIESSALWSTKEIEVFSTQRAIQALTFYFAYASGKELVEEKGGSGGIELRNRTGLQLVLAIAERKDEASQPAPASTAVVVNEPLKDPDRITDEKFTDFCKGTPGWKVLATMGGSAAADVLQSKAKGLGENIISDYKAGKLRDSGSVRLILNSVVRIYSNPESDDGKVRDSELSLLTEQYRDLCARSEATAKSVAT